MQLFISDIHLSPQQPELSTLFQAFLKQHSDPEFKIYILGDLFDIWLGDDFSTQFYQDDIEAIKTCAEQGSQLYLMHGNRDFLMGDELCKSTGLTLISDPYTIIINGTNIVLCHGDQLCTDDVSYQQFRATIQNENWINDFLAKTPQERLAIAEHFRNESKRLSQEKTADITDVNQQAVCDFMQQHETTSLIHGHTHRPQQHTFELNNKQATRWVLGDWHADHAKYLVLSDAQTMHLETFRSL